MDLSTPVYRLAINTTLRAEIEVKHSRFLARVQRVPSTADARRIIADECGRYPDARHHCSAFVVSVSDAQPVLHSSDDGEPSGTAGRPMLDVLQGVPLTDTVAIVTRYFGGTLLGTGGLVRAYSDAVRECLDDAPLAVRQRVPRYTLRLAHAVAGRYLAHFGTLGWDVVPNYGADAVTVTITTGDDVVARVAALSSGTIVAQYCGDHIVDVPWGKVRGGRAVGCDTGPTH